MRARDKRTATENWSFIVSEKKTKKKTRVEGLWGGGWQPPLLFVRGLIVGLSKFDHISSYLFGLHWLLVIYLLLLVYKALNNPAPDYIKASLHKTNPPLRLRSNDRNLLDVPRTIAPSHTRYLFSGTTSPMKYDKVQLRLFLNQS